MKKLFLFLVAGLTLISCNKQEQKPEQPLTHTKWCYDATIYELNTRQFTPEGTFAATEAQLPKLKELGIDIIWIMPLQPIGEVGRKGSLGSYYAIKDYCAFNPEFGTRADFESFLAKAHELGMKVILDWVANHTAPDHPWTNNFTWHERDSLGNTIVQYDWTDIAALNYDDPDMRLAMINSLAWWMDTIGIDGFRCDVAFEVPTDFWEQAMDSIRPRHPDMFMLSEAEHPEHQLTNNVFDMYYGWTLHHYMNDVAQGKKTVADLWSYFDKADKYYNEYQAASTQEQKDSILAIRPLEQDSIFPAKAIRMNFTSNHDENSWNGTEFERMGDAAHLFAAFTYVIPGMPLIYTGQEYANNHRLQFFEKDTIDINPDAKEFEMYKQLNQLRKHNSALLSNELGAPMKPISVGNDNVFACVRQNEENTVIGLFNMSAEEVEISIADTQLYGTYHCTPCNKNIQLNEAAIKLPAWGWRIWTK